MLKSMYLVFIVLLLSSCSSSKVNIVNNYIDISKEKKQFTNDSCNFNSYILNSSSSEYGNIFIEHVSLNTNCIWNGFERSFFDNLFKEKTHIKTMIALERIDFDDYEFSTYLIDDKYIMNLIAKFSVDENTFIVDYKGVLFNEMIKNFDPKYINTYQNKPRFFSNYNSSLVNQNIIENYFSEDIACP